MNAQIELRQLPDMERCEWGKGRDLGKLVSKAGKQSKTPLRISKTLVSVPSVPLPPGPPVAAAPAEAPMGRNEDVAVTEPMDEGAAAAEIPMVQDEDAAAAAQPVQEAQVMEQDLPGVKGLASHRQAAVINRMDPKPDQLVPYVSLSSSEDESDDSEGKTTKVSNLLLLKFLGFSRVRR